MTWLDRVREVKRARSLGRYWDDVAHGDAQRAGTRVSSSDELETLIDALQRTMDSGVVSKTGPDPVLERLLKQHRETNAMSMPQALPPTTGVVSFPGSAPGEPRRLPWWSSARPMAKAAFAATALVLIALVAVIAFDLVERGGSERRPSVPAPMVLAAASPSTEADAGETLVVSYPLPDEVIPVSRDPIVGLRHFTFPANASTTLARTSGDVVQGMAAELILSGTMTMHSDGPMELFRAGQAETPEQVAPNTEITLAPGDVVVYQVLDGKAWTAGPDEVSLISWYVMDRFKTVVQPDQWTETSFDVGVAPRLDPGGYLVRVTRVMLDPEEVRPSPPAGVVIRGVIVPNGEAHLRIGRGTFRTGMTEQTETVYILTLEPLAPAGSPVPSA